MTTPSTGNGRAALVDEVGCMTGRESAYATTVTAATVLAAVVALAVTR